MDQTPPQGDNRYRTHRSVKCYVAELTVGTGGGTWYVNQSAQRVIYLFPGGVEKVVYKNRFYPLQPRERLIEIAQRHLALGGTIMIGGKPFYAHGQDQTFDPYPFIDVTPREDHARFEAIIAARG